MLRSVALSVSSWRKLTGGVCRGIMARGRKQPSFSRPMERQPGNEERKKPVKIKKAVIAVAGFGTRFLPATKVLPKELMPIVDKPVVQYLVEEVVASGVEDVILVTRPGSQGIADHFDSSRELEIHLAEQKKPD